MPQQFVQVAVEQKTYEFGQAMAQFAKSVKESLKDGFQPVTDVPADVVAAYKLVQVAINDLGQIPAEFTEDKAAFIKAIELSVADMVAAVIS
jgi:hypothetical protein